MDTESSPTKARAKLAVVIQAPTFGGAHNQAVKLAPLLNSAGIDTLVLLSHDGEHLLPRLRNGGLNVKAIRLRRLRAGRPRDNLSYVLTLPLQIARLRRIFIRQQVDLVQVHGVTNFDVAIAARLARKRVVWQILDTRAPRAIATALSPLVRTLASSYLVTGTSMLSASGLGTLRNEAITSYLPPVDEPPANAVAVGQALRASIGTPSATVLFGMLANFNPQKGHDGLLVAASLLMNEPSIRFVLRGNTTRGHEAYIRTVRENGFALSNVLSIGPLEPDLGPYEFLSALDALVVPSVARSEGIPTVILEAMKVGVPVISTDVGSISEVVEDGVTGLIVRPGDPEALANAVLRFSRDDALRSAMSAAATRKAQSFSTHATAESYLAAYRYALDSARP